MKHAKFAASFALLCLTTLQPSQAQTSVCGAKFTTGTAATTNIQGSGTGFTIVITGVDGAGAITGSAIGAGGAGYAVGDLGGLNGVAGDNNILWQVDSVSKDDPNLLNGTVLSFHLFPSFLNLSSSLPADASDVLNPDGKFAERANLATKFNSCEPIGIPNACGELDRGEDYVVRIMARLAAGGGLQQAAINSLANVQRSDYGEMGTDGHISGCSFGDKLLSSLADFLTNATRRGDGDVAMIGYTAILYAYGNRGTKIIPQNVYDHVLHDLIDLSPGLGSVETLSFGVKVVPACLAICALPGVDLGILGCAIACPIILGSQSVDVPETENHINMIYASQYLANQLMFDETKDSRYDNAKNGYRSALLNRLNDFTKNDFIEYNAHNYQDFTMFALLSLASYADDPKVQTAAQNVVNYISAKVAVSSNDGRRSTPFRRHNDPGNYFCDELVLQHCADPQTGFYTMLAGVTGALGNFTDLAACTPGKDCLPAGTVPFTYGVEMQWAATTKYRVPPVILDLFDNAADRKFYQFFHYSRILQTDGFNDSNDELYSGSPSFLISAGGHSTHNAYTGDASFPVDLLPISLSPLKQLGEHPGKDDDLGVAPPTTLMPTASLHSRAQMIRFDPSLCVGRNFACGTNPKFGICDPSNTVSPCADPATTKYTIDGPLTPPVPGSNSWTFIEYSSPPTGMPLKSVYGFYAAVYQQDGFGFVEVSDNYGAPAFATLADFKAKVLQNNSGQSFSQSGTNTYTNIDGKQIQFSVSDGKILSFDGKPPYDPNRTSGDIINNDGAGTVTITNPALSQSLTLDATRPPNSPLISVPGPLTFPDTCVGSKSVATLNVCNSGGGLNDLYVYNILTRDSVFQVTEPTSLYPTTIGSSFCYPFQASFAPTIAGSISTKLTISNSDPVSGELTMDIGGKAIQQGIATVIANSGDFGDVCVGSFADLNLTINNNGGCDLSISAITSDSANFTLAGTLFFPLTIHAGDSLAVPIRFHPTQFGAFTGNVTVANNDPKNPNAVVRVSGNAPAPVINATIANSGAFGNVCGGTQADLSLQVLNQGTCPLTISGVTSSQTLPAGGPSFALPSVTNYPLVLKGGGSVNFPVRFQPPAYGSANYVTCSSTVAQTANLVIQSDDPKYPAGLARSVSGIEGCPTLVLSPKNATGIYAFPATVSDPNGTLGCFTDKQIMASNSGICPLTIASLATNNGVDGNGAALPASPLEFKIVNPTAPITIAPGATPVPLTVRFKPVILTDQTSSAPDQQTGTLSIVSNDPAAVDNSAGLCGEPAYQSGVRILVVNTLSLPVSSVANLTLSSQGFTPTFKQTLSPATLQSRPNVCGNAIQYHLDNETLRPAGTTGNNPKGSYSLSAKNGSTQANTSFTLGQCEVKQIILQIK